MVLVWLSILNSFQYQKLLINDMLYTYPWIQLSYIQLGDEEKYKTQFLFKRLSVMEEMKQA